MKKLAIFLMIIFLMLPMAEGYYAENENGTVSAQDNEELVIVLDPGHDSTHAGAGGNGLREEKLVLKIGLYLREELNKYENVKVYMTRESEGCAFPETIGVNEGSKRCNEARVAYAKSVGADVMIALHLNSYSNNASGALAFVPNNNYSPEAGKVGQELGATIVNRLAELGLQNRGIVIKESDTDTRPEEYYYPDGSIADYYRVIRYAKKELIPAIIVEHAFISSASDVSKVLSSEEGLKALALKDAQGIVDYYGLTLKEGCTAGVLPDINEIPEAQPKPEVQPQPEVEQKPEEQPQEQPQTTEEEDSETESESETEVSTEAESQIQEETESETNAEDSELCLPEETESENKVSGDDKEFPWGVVAIAVVVIITGSAGFLFWWNKKKQCNLK